MTAVVLPAYGLDADGGEDARLRGLRGGDQPYWYQEIVMANQKDDHAATQHGGSGNFANDRAKASEAGKKGGQHSHGGEQSHAGSKDDARQSQQGGSSDAGGQRGGSGSEAGHKDAGHKGGHDSSHGVSSKK